MNPQLLDNAHLIAKYLHDNYYDDAERLTKIKMIGIMATHANAQDIPSMIDKIAIFNGIKKSFPDVMVEA